MIESSVELLDPKSGKPRLASRAIVRWREGRAGFRTPAEREERNRAGLAGRLARIPARVALVVVVVVVVARLNYGVGRDLLFKDNASSLNNGRTQLQGVGKSGANLLRLLDLMYEHPILTARIVEKNLDVTFPTAASLIDRMSGLGLLLETTGKKRGRRYSYRPYLKLFQDSEASDPKVARSASPRLVTGGDA